MISTRYRWRKLRKSENSPSRRYFVKIFRAWYPTAHLQRETYCGSQDSLEQLARKFANVFLFRRRFICNHSGLMLFILNHVGGLVLLILNSCEKHWPKVVLKQDHHFVFELSMKSFTKGLLNAIDDMYWYVFWHVLCMQDTTELCHETANLCLGANG